MEKEIKKVTRHSSECIKCLVNKYLSNELSDIDEETKFKYYQGVLSMIAEASSDVSAPEIVAEVSKLQRRLLGKEDDYTEIKKYFNALILSKEDGISKNISSSEEPLRLAAKYAMMGNYIDFGAMENVDENKLNELLNNACEIDFDRNEFDNFKRDLSSAERIVYLTDNCGEIALDKLFIAQIKKEYPNVEIEVIVRGYHVLNDSTLEDALQVGLDKVVKISENGSDIAGTCLDKISKEAREKIDSADVIIAKGQGNFETMRHCGKNVYYLFMCKCKMFADRFNVPRFSGMFLNDKRMKW